MPKWSAWRALRNSRHPGAPNGKAGSRVGRRMQDVGRQRQPHPQPARPQRSLQRSWRLRCPSPTMERSDMVGKPSAVVGKFGNCRCSRASCSVGFAELFSRGAGQPPSPPRLNVEIVVAWLKAHGRPRRLEVTGLLHQEVQGRPLVAHQLHGDVALPLCSTSTRTLRSMRNGPTKASLAPWYRWGKAAPARPRGWVIVSVPAATARR
jgi:hypothetical protein